MTFMWVQLQSFIISLFINLHDEFLLFQNVGSPRESNAQEPFLLNFMGPAVLIFSPSLFFPTVADMFICLLGLK